MVNKIELIVAIRKAFQSVPYPGDDGIVSSSLDEDVAASFRGRSWEALPLRAIFWERGDIFVLTPEAFAYYLPAFMLACLDHYDEMDTLPDSLSHLLTVPEERPESATSRASASESPITPKEWRKYHLGYALALNEEQSAVVKRFLEYLRDLDPRNIGEDCEAALESWWNRFRRWGRMSSQGAL